MATQGQTIVINPAEYPQLFSQETTAVQQVLSRSELDVEELARRTLLEEIHGTGSAATLDLRDIVFISSREVPESNRDSGLGSSRPNSGELVALENAELADIPEEDLPLVPLAQPEANVHSKPKSVSLHDVAHVTHEVFEQIVSMQGAAKGSLHISEEIFEALHQTAKGLGDSKLGFELVFPGLEGILSLPAFFSAGKGAVMSLAEGRLVDFSEHSSEALKASLSLSGAGVELATVAQEIIKEGWVEAAKAVATPTAHAVSTLVLAASGITAAGWAVYGGMQVFALRQMSKPMNNLERILKSSMPEEVKMLEAFKDIEAEFVVTKKEIEEIREKYTDEEKALKEIEILQKKKLNKLKRCVGDKKAKKLSTQMLVISRTLDHARAQLDEAHLIPVHEMLSKLIEEYKNELAKQKVLRYEKLMVSVAGMTAAGVGIACPIAGAAIAIAVSGAAIYLWYQGRKNNAKEYADMKVFGQRLFDFESEQEVLGEGIEEIASSNTHIEAEDIEDFDDSLPEDGILINPAAFKPNNEKA